MLTGAGFEVIDLGVDVPTETFIEKIGELKPDIMGVGCYMTTTMLELKAMITFLKDNGLRDKVKIMIGGVPTTQQFADEIGADFHANRVDLTISQSAGTVDRLIAGAMPGPSRGLCE